MSRYHDDWRAIERDAVDQAALRTIHDPSVHAELKQLARERLLRSDDDFDEARVVARLTPRAVRGLRHLIRGVLDGSIELESRGDDDSPTLPASHE